MQQTIDISILRQLNKSTKDKIEQLSAEEFNELHIAMKKDLEELLTAYLDSSEHDLLKFLTLSVNIKEEADE